MFLSEILSVLRNNIILKETIPFLKNAAEFVLGGIRSDHLQGFRGRWFERTGLVSMTQKLDRLL